MFDRFIPFDRYIFDVFRAFYILRKRITPADTIFISMPWFSVLLLGFLPCKKLILDFRDLLIGNPIFSKFPFMERNVLSRLLRRGAEYVVLQAGFGCMEEILANKDLWLNGVSQGRPL